ncbi:hypothetical protein LTR94_025003 [Friedmanniomyces endolithicus]|nr:hypothetical protein LTR94_025003 [Friedmanniomyces endolithicus]
MSQSDARSPRPPREKIFNAPFLPLLIAASMPVLFYLQERLPDQGLSMAFVPAELWRGQWAGLFTSMLLHGGWAHVTMNAVGALAFGAPGGRPPLVGASGAVFGLIGAATRLMGGHGRVLPLFHPMVLKASAAWMAVNLIVGLIGLAPGADGARIAWEAHAVGFLFGIVAIGPIGGWFAARRDLPIGGV